jgi:hypothetical protein
MLTDVVALAIPTSTKVSHSQYSEPMHRIEKMSLNRHLRVALKAGARERPQMTL